jgi:acyl-CoA synthetase (AMP-forming)/AMP-acid ligase II
MDTVFLQFDTTIAVPSRATSSVSGNPANLRAPPLNLAIAFSRVATARANHPALETGKSVFLYERISLSAQHVSQYLRGRPDFNPGMRVALKLSNSAEYLAAFYGVLLADCVVVPLPVSIEKTRWQHIQKLCSPQLAISRHEDSNDLNDDSATTLLRLPNMAGEMSLPLPSRRGDDLAMILFTSGSTGVPKGVMLSHSNLLANAESILQDLPITSDDKTLVLVPFCHSFGNSILQTHVLAGATMVVGADLRFPSSVTQTLSESGATSFSAIPEVYDKLLKYGKLGERPLPKLRYMTVAGGEIRPDAAKDIAARIAPATFHVMYGQSEAAPRLTSLSPDQLLRRPGSIGKPISGVELAVRDDAGRDLHPFEVGMLYARGENIMLGYWNDSEATASVLNDDGWLQTGDLAYRDDDGFFYLEGRANLLVKIQGHRVHPLEIEEIVETSFPNTRAIALPMVRAGETRFALFVTSLSNQTIDVSEIRAVCMRELPTYKVPLHFEVVNELPLTSAYKVDRVALSLKIPQ